MLKIVPEAHQDGRPPHPGQGPIVVPTAASQTDAATVPRDQRNESNRRQSLPGLEAQPLRLADAMGARKERRTRVVRGEVEPVAAHPRQEERLTVSVRLFDQTAGRHFPVHGNVCQDRLRVGVRLKASEVRQDRAFGRRHRTGRERTPPLAYLTPDFVFRAVHPVCHSTTGTGPAAAMELHGGAQRYRAGGQRPTQSPHTPARKGGSSAFLVQWYPSYQCHSVTTPHCPLGRTSQPHIPFLLVPPTYRPVPNLCSFPHSREPTPPEAPRAGRSSG